mmetsp:Transcript_28724/g.60993  ORF Transcript_28724/g.60993 Transcript_28724/m.60993 type:complete len:392 (-) Transcript_28724:141-1316(-)
MMMLNADAAVFVPQTQEKGSDEGMQKGISAWGGSFDDGSSTAVPSPALTAVSSASAPWGSPYWEMRVEDAAACMAWGGCEPFTLPDAEEAGDTEFVFSGMEDLQSSLAGLLEKHAATTTNSTASEESTSPTAEAFEMPPGLPVPPAFDLAKSPKLDFAPPPGLGAPPGLEGLEACPPEPLDKSVGGFITVAELHAQFQSQTGAAEEEQSGSAEVRSPPSLTAGCTTVMLRNIPNKYSRDMLVERIHTCGFKGDLDFLYLPIDFKNKCNVGYAFMSFRSEEACTRFANEWHLVETFEKLPGFRSKKIIEVTEARCQGREENVRRLSQSPVMAQLAGQPLWLPRLLDSNGEAEEFPVPEAFVQAQSPAAEPTRWGRVSRGGRGRGGSLCGATK